VLDRIRVPTLLVQALDDPFLSASCFPRSVAARSATLHLATPRWGGHVGFVAPGGTYWSEAAAVQFLRTEDLRAG
jgi:predicted alpha/beta-fold hydrolase